MAKEKSNTTPAKSAKTTKKEPNKLVKWFKDLRSEFKKVVWPSRKTVINNTSVVLGVVIFCSILVGLVDTGFLRLFNLIFNR